MVLTVLKIIGIVLLVLLAILLFIVLNLLFLPVRYRFDARYEGDPFLDAQVKFFPVLLNATVLYQGGALTYIVRMFGGVVMTNTDAKLSFIGRKFFSEKKEETLKTGDFTVIEEPVIELEEPEDRASGTAAKSVNKAADGSVSDKKQGLDDDVSDKTQETDDGVPDKTQETDGGVSDKEGKSGAKKKKKEKKPLSERIAEIKGKIKDVAAKLRNINEKKDELVKVYNSKRFSTAKKDIILYFKKILSIIKPKRLEGRLHFGLKDPATTGEILGVLAMFLPLYEPFLIVEPEFENPCIEGHLKGRGRFRLGSFVWLVIKIIFNKNLIKVIKKVQTIITES